MFKNKACMYLRLSKDDGMSIESNSIINQRELTLLDASGYMARAAFIMDRIMHKIGLYGKSFIPLMMGFGCSVPAIMATRTIENRNSRMITILVTSFISCSARLPVYILLIGTFFAKYQALVMDTTCCEGEI